MLYILAFVVFGLLSSHALVPNRFLSMKDANIAKSKVLIIQNKGGGHGEIGYQLCKTLKGMSKDMEIVVLQDDGCNYKKAPFVSYAKDLVGDLGVKVVDAKLSDAAAASSAVGDAKFDIIVDNWSKTAENAKIGIEFAKKSNAIQHIFISSAGMYKPSGKLPHDETDPVKENDARKVELAIIESKVPHTFLRPQYIYGPNANKRYLDFFIGRAARKLPIPLPVHGEQLIALTHIEDVCALVAATMGKEQAMGQVFNCGTSKFVSYKGLSDMTHKALGNDVEKDAKYIYYEPKDFPDWDGSGVQEFPFRRETFITTPSKATTLLGWTPKKSIIDDIKAEVAIYEKTGGLKESWSNEKELKYDEEIMAKKK